MSLTWSSCRSRVARHVRFEVQYHCHTRSDRLRRNWDSKSCIAITSGHFVHSIPCLLLLGLGDALSINFFGSQGWIVCLMRSRAPTYILLLRMSARQAVQQLTWNTDLPAAVWDRRLAEMRGHPLQSALWGDARYAVDGIQNHRWA